MDGRHVSMHNIPNAQRLLHLRVIKLDRNVSQNYVEAMLARLNLHESISTLSFGENPQYNQGNLSIESFLNRLNDLAANLDFIRPKMITDNHILNFVAPKRRNELGRWKCEEGHADLFLPYSVS